MKPYFVFGLVLLGTVCLSQQSITPPKEYFTNVSTADSLTEAGRHKEATIFYVKAVEAFSWRGIADDRYKAAKAFVKTLKIDSAFAYLQKLCNQQYVNHLKLTTDLDFASLRRKHTQKWNDVLTCIRHNKDSLAPDQDLAWTNYLDSIYQTDQGIRRKFMKTANAYGWDAPQAKALLPKMRFIDSINLVKVESFLAANGWPGPEELGRQGSSTLFLVIQHSDSATQEKYIPLLRDAVKKRKARPEDLALMEDRLSMAKFGYQIYGSQIVRDTATKKFVLQPIIDEQNVDKRRTEVGLTPLKEYARNWGIDYKSKGK